MLETVCLVESLMFTELCRLAREAATRKNSEGVPGTSEESIHTTGYLPDADVCHTPSGTRSMS